MSNVTLDTVKKIAAGRWLSILGSLAPSLLEAIDKKGRHVTCPIHLGKRDFRFDREHADETGKSYCTCGIRDGFQLLIEINNWSFSEALEKVADFLGVSSMEPVAIKKLEEKSEKERKQRELERAVRNKLESEKIAKHRNVMWEKSHPITSDKSALARRYLVGRGLNPDIISNHIRFHPGVSLRNEEGNIVGFYPALIARVYSNEGRPITLHRTYLDRDSGGKIQGEDPKKLMPVPEIWESLKGRIIPVTTAGSPTELGVAEGIETALAASMATGMSVWALVSAGPMRNFVPPTCVKVLTIFADLDYSGTGEDAANTLKQNLKESGWKGRVVIKVPPKSLLKGRKSIDWADVFYEYGAIGFDSAA